MSAEMWVAILGIAGTLLGWWVKRFWVAQAAKEATEQRQKDEQKSADDHEQKWADDAATRTITKEGQDAAFSKAWAENTPTDPHTEEMH